MPAIGQSTNAYEFSFDRPNHSTDLNAVQEVINADPAVQAEGATAANPPAEPATPAEITPPPAAQTVELEAQPAATAAKSQTEELKTYKITVDGQELEVTEADLKSGHMRHRDYTQKTQTVAAEREAVRREREQWQQEKTAVSQELSAIDKFLRDQAAVDAYYEKAFGVRRGEVIAPPQIDPNKPPSAEEVAAIARYNAEQVRIHTDRQIAEIRQEALKAQQLVLAERAHAGRSSAEATINQHLTSLLDKYPVLKKFEGIEEDLFGEAARYMPSDRQGTLEDAKQRLSEAADRRMATIRAIADDEKKQAAVSAAKLKQHSTEAPGGAVPRPAGGRKLTLNTGDRKDFLAAAEADLRAIMDGTNR